LKIIFQYIVILHNIKKRAAYNRTAEIPVYLKPGITGKDIGIKATAFIETLAKKAGIKHLLQESLQKINTVLNYSGNVVIKNALT
jgi:L-amino acid N-acyltransferase YncA